MPYIAKLWWCQSLVNLVNYLSIAKYNPPNYAWMIHIVLVSPKFNLIKLPWR